MIAYIVLAETLVCDEPTPCEHSHQCEMTHKKRSEWRLNRLVSTTLGPMHAAMNRIAGERKYYRNKENGTGSTGHAEIRVIDIDQLKPLWSEAEQAAYKIGGLDAVKKLQKSQAAEARGQERLRLKAEKEEATRLAKALKAKARAELKAKKAA